MVVKVKNLWQHQLISLSKEGHNDKDIFDAIRSSLHGKAGNIVVRLGTDEEEGNLKTLFAQMGARPKTNTKEDLQRWMIDYVASLNLTPRTDDSD